MKTDLSYTLAFVAGMASFLSPCVLPLVPSYVTFITGISFEDLTATRDRARVRFLTVTNSLAFILGFSFVFIMLGASSSFVGRIFFEYKDIIRIVGGILIILFGLFISGILKMDFLMRERKIHLSGKPAGYIGTFLIGMTFAAGWTPCIGPILGSILIFAGSKGSASYGLKLLAVYSLGLALPFFVASLAINTFISYSRRIQRYMRVIMLLSGIILIVFGIMLLTDQVKELAGLLPDIGLDM